MVSELSPEAYDTLHVLKRTPNGVPEDNLPPGITVELLDFLVSEGYVRRRMLEPPSVLRPFGVVGYDLSSKGHNALLASDERHKREAEEEKRRSEADIKHDKEVRQNRKHQYLVALFQFFLGVISGLFLEHYTQIIAFVTEFIETTSFHG